MLLVKVVYCKYRSQYPLAAITYILNRFEPSRPTVKSLRNNAAPLCAHHKDNSGFPWGEFFINDFSVYQSRPNIKYYLEI